MKLDDVFGIKVTIPKYHYGKCHTSNDIDGLDESEVNTEIVYFKVVKLKGGFSSSFGLFGVIDFHHLSHLTQETSVHSRIPPNLPNFMGISTYINGISAGYKNMFKKMIALTKPALHPLSSALGLHLSLLLHGAQGVGKGSLIVSIAHHFGLHLFKVNCYDWLGQAEGQTERNVKSTFESSKQASPCILLLKNIEAIQKSGTAQEHEEPPIANLLKECIQSIQQAEYPIVVIATTSKIEDLASTVRSSFREEIKIDVPDVKAREEIVTNLIKYPHQLVFNVSPKYVAQNTPSFTPKLLQHTIYLATLNALTKAIHQFSEPAEEEVDVCSAGVGISVSDVDAAIAQVQQQESASLGAPKVPNVKWEDVGGLITAKKEILDTIQLPLEHPELFGKGLKQRSGVLLYGPPGTGKTLLAKAVATECTLNFISVKGPELINMYVGESEKNVRQIFQRARDSKPCVIFFDELDSLAPNRGKNGDSGGVMDRVVSQLLAELSDINSSSDIFVIGATNRPDLIDPALLVPGRFDKLLYLGVASDKDSQYKVLKALTRKFNLEPNTDIRKVVEHCPNNLTGADFYALASDAYSIAIHDLIQNIEARGEIQLYRAGNKKAQVQVSEVHFQEALKRLSPSVSPQELLRYQSLHTQFSSK
uniref:Peroxisomal ATPase PEX6 n=1 Tax=Arcella intermedia TaxID=1963864 RepID=A0A6B2KZ37_9EUKA